MPLIILMSQCNRFIVIVSFELDNLGCIRRTHGFFVGLQFPTTSTSGETSHPSSQRQNLRAMTDTAGILTLVAIHRMLWLVKFHPREDRQTRGRELSSGVLVLVLAQLSEFGLCCFRGINALILVDWSKYSSPDFTMQANYSSYPASGGHDTQGVPSRRMASQTVKRWKYFIPPDDSGSSHNALPTRLVNLDSPMPVQPFHPYRQPATTSLPPLRSASTHATTAVAMPSREQTPPYIPGRGSTTCHSCGSTDTKIQWYQVKHGKKEFNCYYCHFKSKSSESRSPMSSGSHYQIDNYISSDAHYPISDAIANVGVPENSGRGESRRDSLPRTSNMAEKGQQSSSFVSQTAQQCCFCKKVQTMTNWYLSSQGSYCQDCSFRMQEQARWGTGY
ncbi:hypothetical protein C8J56DRAFT_1124709 [Mycena floridula]|nr:hypothetical protein C8J56DRAFT_1124709 [Mycena floridula]